MSAYVLARSGTHHATLCVPDGGCDCGADAEMVALACRECRGLPWADCEKCGSGCVESERVWHASVEGPICAECAARFCSECGCSECGCRCCHADDAYDRARDEGAL